MILGMSFTDSRSRIGMLVLDVMTRETITFDGAVTKYPVEDGTNISDHIALEPEQLTLAGKVSSSEMIIFGGFGMNYDKIRLVEGLDAIQQMRNARSLITVTTGLGMYTDMGIEKFEASRTSKNGNWLEINCTLIRVRKVSLRETEIRAAPSARGRAGSTQRANANSNASTNSNSGDAANQRRQTMLKRLEPTVGPYLREMFGR